MLNRHVLVVLVKARPFLEKQRDFILYYIVLVLSLVVLQVLPVKERPIGVFLGVGVGILNQRLVLVFLKLTVSVALSVSSGCQVDL